MSSLLSMPAYVLPLQTEPEPVRIPAPELAYGQLSPLLIVLGVACLQVLLEAFVPRRWRYLIQVSTSLGGLVLAGFATVLVALGSTPHAVTAEGAIALDGPGLFIWVLLIALTALSVLLFSERRIDGGLSGFSSMAAAVPGSTEEREATKLGWEHTEVYPLTMFAVGGMMLFSVSNDLLLFFVALEVFSLPLYLLCGLARRRRLLSQEAALKYFLLGAFSSAFFLFGIAMVYGATGSTSLTDISGAVGNLQYSGLLLLGTGMLAVGLLFKVGAVPFHSWTPDVYQGAPTSVTGFMAACTKIAAFAGLFRIFYVGLGAYRWDWQPMMWVFAGLTMVVGSVLAVTQTDIKRMLAYSSIAHAGFLLTAFAGVYSAAGRLGSLQAVLFYLVTYGFATVGAFAIVTVVRDAGGEATHLSRWAGLGKRSPLLAGVFAFFLLAFAGIPLTAGFTGKWAVFSAAWAGGAWPLVVLAVLCSLVTAFFYVRVIVLMFFTDPGKDAPDVALPGWQTLTAIGVGLAATVLLGILPTPVLDLATRAGMFIR